MAEAGWGGGGGQDYTSSWQPGEAVTASFRLVGGTHHLDGQPVGCLTACTWTQASV